MSDCSGRNTLAATWLGDIELSPHLRLRGQHEWTAANIEEKRTIDGRHLWFADVKQGGRPLILDGEGGHFTVGELAAIRELQAAGQPVALTHHSGTYNVIVAGIEGVELPIDYADYRADDWVSAQINLIEVLT